MEIFIISMYAHPLAIESPESSFAMIRPSSVVLAADVADAGAAAQPADSALGSGTTLNAANQSPSSVHLLQTFGHCWTIAREIDQD